MTGRGSPASSGGGSVPSAGGSAPSGGTADGLAPATPPLRVPGQHFAAALLFLLAGAAALVWRAPALAAGAYSDPGVVAATHLLTLGWISTSLMGALHQIVPVELGGTFPWPRLTDLTFVVWTAGVAAFAGGVAAGLSAVRLAGAAALGLGALLFAAHLAAALRGSRSRGLTWWCLAGAGLFLVGGWVLGMLLTVNLSAGVLGGSRPVVLAVHLHLAAGGWVLLAVVGVAHRVMPAFLSSHGAPDGPGRAAAAMVGAGSGGLLLSGHLLPTGVLRPALALLAAGTVAFLAQAAVHFRHRRRARLDPGLRLAAGALLLLAGAVAAGATALVASSPSSSASVAGPRLLTAYGLLLVPGGLGLLVAGHCYRIVPFLTWSHRFAPEADRRPVPGPDELLHAGRAHAAAALLVAGALAMAAGALAGRVGLCRIGAAAYAAGALVEAVQLLGVLRRRPT